MGLVERLLDKIQMEPNSGCWLWTGATNPGGYGGIAVNGKRQSAHRVSYELFKCDIPHGLDLDHLCRVRCCVNPEHLEPVSRGENCRRGETVNHLRDAQRLITHCPQGHAYAGDNLFININGTRRCRACRDLQNRKQYLRRKRAA